LKSSSRHNNAHQTKEYVLPQSDLPLYDFVADKEAVLVSGLLNDLLLDCLNLDELVVLEALFEDLDVVVLQVVVAGEGFATNYLLQDPDSLVDNSDAKTGQ